MSTETVQQLLQDVQVLSEEDQQLVLSFVASVAERRDKSNWNRLLRITNPSVVEKDGLLVFTGKIDGPDIDWVREDRIERERELLARVNLSAEQ